MNEHENSNSTEIKDASLTFKELKDIIEYRMDGMIEIMNLSEGLFDYSKNFIGHQIALKILEEIFEERKQYK